MRRIIAIAAVVAAPMALTFCSDNDNDLVPGPSTANVQVQDDCDSASFNAGLGAGACKKAGTTTLSAFNNELGATERVAAWQFLPATLTIRQGDMIAAMNAGGERHSFTEVAQYGGGIVPALNQAAGTPNVAPECQALADNQFLQPGATFTTDPENDVGVEHYQCCIHPWMRTEVTVVAR